MHSHTTPGLAQETVTGNAREDAMLKTVAIARAGAMRKIIAMLRGSEGVTDEGRVGVVKQCCGGEVEERRSGGEVQRRSTRCGGCRAR